MYIDNNGIKQTIFESCWELSSLWIILLVTKSNETFLFPLTTSWRTKCFRPIPKF